EWALHSKMESVLKLRPNLDKGKRLHKDNAERGQALLNEILDGLKDFGQEKDYETKVQPMVDAFVEEVESDEVNYDFRLLQLVDSLTTICKEQSGTLDAVSALILTSSQSGKRGKGPLETKRAILKTLYQLYKSGQLLPQNGELAVQYLTESNQLKSRGKENVNALQFNKSRI
ncbi:unnamed protein product, partial [marine sediment metagenome]